MAEDLIEWMEAIALIEDIAFVYDNQKIFDKTRNCLWDAGQAVCREMYGPHWESHPMFIRDNASQRCPIEFATAARRIINAETDWASPPRRSAPATAANPGPSVGGQANA